jgi:hypothetical protein
MGGHWESVFSAKPSDATAAKESLGRYARRLPDIQWISSESKFFEILGKLFDSGSGPDGIRYSGWSHALYVFDRYYTLDTVRGSLGTRYPKTSTTPFSVYSRKDLDQGTKSRLYERLKTPDP